MKSKKVPDKFYLTYTGKHFFCSFCGMGKRVLRLLVNGKGVGYVCRDCVSEMLWVLVEAEKEYGNVG